MKSKRLIFFLLVISIVGLMCHTDSWAITAYMRVEGASQGAIPGDANHQGYDGWIAVASFGHSVSIPLDPVSGLPSTRRVHEPLRIVKPLDRSTPLLYKALCTGETLTEVEIRFLRFTPEGQEEHFYTIFLEEAIITNASPSLIPANESNNMMEIISFTYRRIKWTFELDGIEHQDDWRTEPQ
jgi:type VI secretion system secreted protein Hcp